MDVRVQRHQTQAAQTTREFIGSGVYRSVVKYGGQAVVKVV